MQMGGICPSVCTPRNTVLNTKQSFLPFIGAVGSILTYFGGLVYCLSLVAYYHEGIPPGRRAFWHTGIYAHFARAVQASIAMEMFTSFVINLYGLLVVEAHIAFA